MYLPSSPDPQKVTEEIERQGWWGNEEVGGGEGEEGMKTQWRPQQLWRDRNRDAPFISKLSLVRGIEAYHKYSSLAERERHGKQTRNVSCTQP